MTRKNPLSLLIIVSLITVGIIGYWAIWADISPVWTGFGEFRVQVDPGIEYQRTKTLWDWMQLLLIPFILGVGTWWLSKIQKDTELKIAKEQRKEDQRIADQKEKADREIAQDRQQQALLDAYFDRMTNLILEKSLKGSESQEAQLIARTHTLTVLRTLDGKRKGLVLRFLYESGLINDPPIVNLRAAELRHADLVMIPVRELYDTDSWNQELITKFVMDYEKLPHGYTKSWSAILWKAVLNDADLSNAALILANLSYSSLYETNLSGAILLLANLNGAYLAKANLRRADLRKADLAQADLTGADLSFAKLQDANLSMANLENANLVGAVITPQQLQSAKSLEGAIMPDGSFYHQ